MAESAVEIGDSRPEGKLSVGELFQAIKTSQEKRGYTPDPQDQEKKYKILESLMTASGGLSGSGPGLLEEMRAHLHLAEVERAQFKKEGRESVSLADDQIARGKLFEMLVAQENRQALSALNEELLALAHDPARFGLKDFLGQHRNPDLAFIQTTEKGDLIIEAIGEAKSGSFNRRTYEQLRKNGFWEGLSALTDVLNRIKNLADYGLQETARRKGRREIRLSPNFKQRIFVPANRRIEDARGLVDQGGEGEGKMTDQEIASFVKLLENKNLVSLERSVFSTHDVAALTEVILKKINPDINPQPPQN